MPTVSARPLRGIALMCVAVACFALMDTMAKVLTAWYPVPTIVWMRYAINLALLVAFLALRGGLGRMRTARPGIQSMRGLMLAAATLFYFTSLAVLPIAEAAAIGFSLPLFVALLAVPMLGERLDAARAAAILAGLAGALLIVRPGSALFTPWALLPVAMALCNALYQILTRKVAGTEHPYTSLFWGTVVGAVLLAPLAAFAWVTPQGLVHWLLLTAIGVLGALGHLALIRAYEHAPTTLLAPFVYTQLAWVMLLGWLVFGDFPDAIALTGMAVIVLAGLYLVSRQRLAVRRTS